MKFMETKFLNAEGNVCSVLECRTWQGSSLMKACYVGGFNKELTLWYLAQLNVLFMWHLSTFI